MPSRWDLLLEQKPKALTDFLLDEAAKQLSADLALWPLPVLELDPILAPHWVPLIAVNSARPSPAVFEASFQLARWDLRRQFAAYDDYMRNQRWLEAGVRTGDKQALLFISTWLVEQLLGLCESTSGRLKRAQLLDCLDRIQHQLTMRA